MKDSLNAAIRRKLCNKNKNVKYVHTCKNISTKNLKKVAFLSGLSRFGGKKNDTLGPGIYNISFPKFQTKKNGKFPGRPQDLKINSNLPPTLYADGLKHHTIQTRVEKKITARGPYDTFTGPRDSSTLMGLTAEKKCYFLSDNWPLPLETYASKSHRTYTNVFKQESPRKKIDHSVPSFSCANMPNWLSKKTNKYPFNDSKRAGNSLKMIEDSLKPGPGHYNINVHKRCTTNGPTSVFKSTTVQRLQIVRQSYSIFD
ncbi:uncharacterized protein LOC100575869 [Acyrthosiphon pisum]|uniref:Uncharacterized protein n=1 Tax=Acyrthosiphon pisum TaxID=7029 RepID=A0A8R2ACT0_ACYPI|nr:uncharacterized protein LOC100575869 [Acyrthosiphon pisum]|eukprot:XP_003240933.1 PREDICTED: uncharacterized protein LOC100575869 [Acyrthosiphon pisum]